MEQSNVIDLGRRDEPCAYVSKMRTAETFDRWCYVHHHWLNGAPAESCGERFAHWCSFPDAPCDHPSHLPSESEQ